MLKTLDEVKEFLQGRDVHHGDKWVIQKYISKPLLIGGRNWANSPQRKFDIRMYALAQVVDGQHFRGYFYKEGYVRTSSYEFSATDLEDRGIHLTNDAVQNKSKDYGRYESGNKISFKDFAQYLRDRKGMDFHSAVLPAMKAAVRDTLDALWSNIQMSRSVINQFELFGYDFMLDEDGKVYLIEVNTNPCLDTSPCPLLQRVVGQVLD